jgi:predicted nucleic acid-binding protein
LLKILVLLKVIQQLITVLKQKQGFTEKLFYTLILMPLCGIEELEKQFKEISAACKPHALFVLG